MRVVRRMIMVAVALAVCAAVLPGNVAAARTAARPVSGVPPYCVQVGGARGSPLPQICRFFDYQSCLQAAADLHGNCVANIDFHGELPNTAGATWWHGTR